MTNMTHDQIIDWGADALFALENPELYNYDELSAYRDFIRDCSEDDIEEMRTKLNAE